MSFYVYILYSEAFDKFYIGQTNNINERIDRHNVGTVKATKPYVPWKIIWSVEKKSRSEAMELEKKLKNLSRKRILAFIQKSG